MEYRFNNARIQLQGLKISYEERTNMQCYTTTREIAIIQLETNMQWNSVLVVVLVLILIVTFFFLYFPFPYSFALGASRLGF